VTRGFRAPNIDDVSIFDERAEGTEIPNPGLSPERSLTYEVGLKYQDDKWSGSAFYHDGRLTDLLVRAPGTFEGRSFFDRDGDGFQDPSDPNVLQKQNLGQARISGVELDLSYAPGPQWALFGNFTRTVGNDELTDVPLPRIPPAFGIGGVRWASSSRRGAWAEAVYRFATAQRRLSPVDISDSRVGPGGTDGFGACDVRGGVSAGGHFRASLAFENITDRRYKYHGSGVFRPGLQVVLGAEYRY
jgi:outer membrane receptor protein involved in Fe transport